MPRKAAASADSYMPVVGGAVIGGLLVWFLMSSAIASNNYGMMRMMGFRNGNTNWSGNTSMKSANIDQHFIEQMVPHHEDAVTMSKIALQKSQRQEIKNLAGSIISSQTKEIDQMKTWYKQWYGSDVPEENESGFGSGMMGGGGMRMGMMGDETDVSRLEHAADFDRAFIEEMIPHHQTAVMMANMLQNGTQRDEMKQLAGNIINTQTSEIGQMRDWYRQWVEK